MYGSSGAMTAWTGLFLCCSNYWVSYGLQHQLHYAVLVQLGRRGRGAGRDSPPVGQGLLILNDAPQSVRLLWTSNQLDAEIST